MTKWGLAEAKWLDGERLKAYPRIFLALYAACIIGWIALGDGALDNRGEPIGTDFVSFWTASSLALQGEPETAYDFARHHAAEKAAVGSDEVPYYSWHYPPMFMVLALPLALLPYLWSLFAWMASTLAAYLLVIRNIAPLREGIWLAAAFPAVFINLGHGQNGFLSTALLGGALLLLDRRPLVAGILIAALSFKPQLGILIPLVLIVSGRWQAFVSATVATAVFAGTAYAAFGIETWIAFLDNIPVANRVLTEGIVPWEKMQSTFASVRLLGGGVDTAYAAHGIVAMLAVAAVLWVWRQPVGLPFKGSALVVGTLLTTPFLLDYDLMLLALPLAWLGYDGYRRGFLPWEKLVLTILWVEPLLARIVNNVVPLPLTPVLLLATMMLIVRRVTYETGRAEAVTLAEPPTLIEELPRPRAG